MSDVRVLVTGSRNWSKPEVVNAVLDMWWTMIERTGHRMILVEGACPTGADHMAYQWAVTNGVANERHPADWDRFGKSAGPLRNRDMVNLGALVCLAFPLGESRGTRHCMRVAANAGIPVNNYSRFPLFDNHKERI